MVSVALLKIFKTSLVPSEDLDLKQVKYSNQTNLILASVLYFQLGLEAGIELSGTIRTTKSSRFFS